MTQYVQSFDANLNAYVKIEVASGNVVEQSPRPFAGIDEVEPIEVEQPERAEQSDPLAGMRGPRFRLQGV